MVVGVGLGGWRLRGWRENTTRDAETRRRRNNRRLGDVNDGIKRREPGGFRRREEKNKRESKNKITKYNKYERKPEHAVRRPHIIIIIIKVNGGRVVSSPRRDATLNEHRQRYGRSARRSRLRVDVPTGRRDEKPWKGGWKNLANMLFSIGIAARLPPQDRPNWTGPPPRRVKPHAYTTVGWCANRASFPYWGLFILYYFASIFFRPRFRSRLLQYDTSPRSTGSVVTELIWVSSRSWSGNIILYHAKILSPSIHLRYEINLKKKNELFLSTINNIHLNKYFFDNFRNNITFLIIIFTTNEPLSCTAVAVIK